MSENIESPVDKKPRLKFIDMARSIAIILMLEGHFTGAALSDEYRTNDYLLYKIWHNIHGFTSPLFFTVTGLIFVYLLSANTVIKYFDNIRVKKGFKRVIELLFWGYLIQLNLWSIGKSIYYGSELRMEWFYAFHVLQSIGIGILIILIIYGLKKWIGKGALHWYYLVAALVIFIFYAHLKDYINSQELLVAENIKDKPDYFPSGAPLIIQNMFYGPYSDFSILRYSGYVLLGGMLGSIIRTYERHALKFWFGFSFILIGIFLNLFIQKIFYSFDSFTDKIGLTQKGIIELNSTSFVRFGQVIAFLGSLMLIDKYMNIKAKLFLKIGQNTLPIYVVHVIILYGGIFGFGLSPMAFNRNLHPLTAISISLFSILMFALMVKYIEPLERYYSKVLHFIKLKR